MAINLNNENQAYQACLGTNTSTSGYVNCCPSEREKYCPRDGQAFNAGDNYCAKCARPVGWITRPYSGGWWGYDPSYGPQWGNQISGSIAQAQMKAAQASLDFENGVAYGLK